MTRPALDTQYDGVCARPRGRLGDDVVDQSVEVERERLQPLPLRRDDPLDRPLDAGRDRVEMAAEPVEHELETPLGVLPRPAHGIDSKPTGHQYRARRDNPNHHRT